MRVATLATILLWLIAVLPGLAEKPKNKLVLEAPWLVHLPKLLLWYAVLPCQHTGCPHAKSINSLPAL